MTSMDRRTFMLAGLALGSSAVAAPAEPAARTPGLLEQVVPQLTGQNGYEELVAAVDQLRASQRFLAAEQQMGEPGFTLTLQRRILADPPVARALALLQRGLAKPVLSPRDAVSPSTLFPELGGFRQLGRLLKMQQYVALADGRAADAIDTLRTGLRLAQVIQTDTLLSGLVGVAVFAITARSFGAHLEQLAARDCERLDQVCAEQLRQPDPLPAMIDAERRDGQRALAELATGQTPVEDIVGDVTNPQTGEVDAAKSALLAEVKQQQAAGGLAAIAEQAQKQLDEHYQRILAELQKPAWQRSWPGMPAGGDLAARLAAEVGISPQPVSDKYTAMGAMVRMLAVHAAILRYRWEEDRLPASLALLNLGDLAVDPFTGQPLKYEVTGRRYRLSSTGAAGSAPVSVTPE